MRNCSKCKEEKDESEFHVRKTGEFYYQCKECCRKYTKQHYVKNKQYYINKAKDLEKELVKLIRNLKSSTPCQDCKNKYPYYVMDFDHRIAKHKKFCVSNRKEWGREKLLKEIKKCDIVCSNCHRIRTFLRARGDNAITSGFEPEEQQVEFLSSPPIL